METEAFKRPNDRKEVLVCRKEKIEKANLRGILVGPFEC